MRKSNIRGFASAGIILSVVVVLVVAVVIGINGLGLLSAPKTSSTDSNVGLISGPVHNTIESFAKGISTGGTFASFTANGTIDAGSNQGHWTNSTGRTVYINPGNVRIGYTSGTASSSFYFSAGTSTATTFTDYARPTPATLIIDMASVATSTGTGGGAITFVGTTTSAGKGISVPNGSSVVFSIQSNGSCKTVGACETATSTNRGISQFFWALTASYQP